MLSKVNAQKIVQELSGVIGHKINIMDEKGQIIASSDSWGLITKGHAVCFGCACRN